MVMHRVKPPSRGRTMRCTVAIVVLLIASSACGRAGEESSSEGWLAGTRARVFSAHLQSLRSFSRSGIAASLVIA